MKVNRSALNIVILFIFVGITILWTVTSNQWVPDTPKNNVHAPVKPAPDFTYTTITGDRSSLYAHQGEIVLVHFWASWCAPCITEFPTLIDLAENTKGKLTILAISIDEDKSRIEKFLKRLKRSLPSNFNIIKDPQKEISQDLYNTLQLPETFIISPKSKILEKIVGPQENWNSRHWRKKIINIIGE